MSRRFVPRTEQECFRALGDDFKQLNLGLQLAYSGKSPPTSKASDNDALYHLLGKPQPGDWLDSKQEHGQSFQQYAQRMDPKRGGATPRAACDGLLVCPIGASFASEAGQRLLPFLLRYYAAFFPGMTIEVLEKPLPLKDISSRTNDFGHKQYLIGDLFTMMNTNREVISKRRAYSRLGVTLEDIYPGENWNYVFGQSRPLERVGVFSFARHSPLFYHGVHATETTGFLNTSQFIHWILTNCKTMVHETCHNFGILHCVYFHCLMNGSNGPGDSAGAAFLCPVCLRKLMYALRGVCGVESAGSIDDRYANMQSALQELVAELGESSELKRHLEWLECRRAQLHEIQISPPPPAPHVEMRPTTPRRRPAAATGVAVVAPKTAGRPPAAGARNSSQRRTARTPPPPLKSPPQNSTGQSPPLNPTGLN